MKKLSTSLLLTLMAFLFFPLVSQAEETVLTPAQTTVIQANGKTAQNEETVLFNADATAWRCSQAKISGGAFSNMLANYEGSPVVITKFDASEFMTGKTLKKATLKFFSKCTVSGKNSNVQIAHIGTGWDATTATWANTNKAETLNATGLNGNGVNVKTSRVELTQDVTEQLAASTDNTIGFGIFTYTGREQEITDITLTIEAIDASASSTYTVKYVDGNGNKLKESETRSESIGAALAITDADKASIYNADKTKKYIYVSDDAEGKTVAGDASTVITVTFREAATWNYTINAVDESDNVLKVLKTGQNFEAETFAMAYSTYVNVDGTLYESSKSNSDDKKGYCFSMTLSEDNMTKNIVFKPTSIENVVYFSEAEDIEGLTLTTNNNTKIRSSNGASAYAAESDVEFTKLPNGKYTLTTVICDVSKTPASEWNYIAGKDTVFTFTATAVNWVQGKSDEFTLNNKETGMLLAKGGNNNMGVDFIYIQKTGDAELIEPAGPVTINFNDSAYAVSSSSATDGDIKENKVINAGDLTLTISPKEEGNSTENRFWGTTAGPQLHVYSGTLTLEAAEGKAIKSLTISQKKWNAENSFNGVVSDKSEWTGNSTNVVLSIAGNTQINKIEATIEDADENTTTYSTAPAIAVAENIAALKALADETEATLTLNNTKVVVSRGASGLSGRVSVIEDASGAVALGSGVMSMLMELGASEGKAVTGKVTGIYSVINGVPTFSDSENTGATGDEVTAVEDTEIAHAEATIADAKKEENLFKIVDIKDITLEATGMRTFTATQNEEQIAVEDVMMTPGWSFLTDEYMSESGEGYNLPAIESMTALVYKNAEGATVLYPMEIVAKEEQQEVPVVWDFTKWSEETANDLKAEAATVEPDADGKYPAVTPWRSYEKVAGPSEAEPDRGGAVYWYGTEITEAQSLWANGHEIAETAGLLFDKVGAGSIAIALNYPETTLGTYAGPAYLWIGGKDFSFVIPGVKPGATIEIGLESHKSTDARGLKLSVDGTEFAQCVPTTFETFRVVVPESDAETVDVKLTNTNGCHIYTIGITDYQKTDGINGVTNNVKNINNDVYSINGVKVRNAGESLNGLAKGLYIIGGKKVVIK